MAQLGARMTGSHEVRGSIPLCSTINREKPSEITMFQRAFVLHNVIEEADGGGKTIMSIDRELEMILYSTPESDVTVSAIIKDETLWLNQKSALLRMLGWRILQGFQSLFHFLKKRCFHRLLREYPTDSLL